MAFFKTLSLGKQWLVNIELQTAIMPADLDLDDIGILMGSIAILPLGVNVAD